MNARTLFVTFIAAVFLAAALAVHGGDRPLVGIPGDTDGDGVPDSADACPSVDASFFDRDGDGCVDDPAGARHTEYWAADQLPFVYRICADGAPGIADGSDLTALQAAMEAWAAIPGADFSVSYAGTTPQQDADILDRINLITFSDDTYPFPTAVLAVGISTSFTVDSTYEGTFYRPGQIVDADMIFNPLKSLRTPTSGAGTIDIQSVATHEAGHLFGISHSPVRTSTMFYVLPPGTEAATLEAEDELVFLKAYGDSAALALLSRIDGKVVDGKTGAGVPGVIVCAVDAASGDTVAGDYTLPDGSYSFVGLPDGGYYVGIHPLDGSSAIGYLEPAYINTLVDTTAVTAVVAEWWDLAESNNDDSSAKDAISLGGGQGVAGLDIITNIDAVAPLVTGLTPDRAATGVMVSAALKITFSEPIDYTTISGNFEVRDQSGAFITGSVAVLNDDSVLAFTPASAYDFATEYTLTLSQGLKDKFANGLENAFVSTFTTQTPPPLGIQYLSPNKGVVGSKVVISGTGFSFVPEQNTVMFGSEQAVVNSAYPYRLVVTVPMGAATDLVTVTTTQGTSNGLTFTVLSQEEIARGFQSGQTQLPSTPRTLVVLPDGSYAYAATSSGAAAVVVDPGQAGYLGVEPISVPGGLSDLASIPGGKLVYGTGATSGLLHVIDADPTHVGFFNTVIAELGCGAMPLGIAIEPSGGRAYVPTGEGDIQVWDVRQGSATRHEQIGMIRVDEPSLRGGIAVDPAGERLLALTGTGRLLVYALGPDTLLASIAVGPDPRRVQVDPAGRRCYVSDGGGAVAVVSLTGLFKVQDITTGGSLRGMTVTPAGMYLYAANRGYKLLDVIDLGEDSPAFRSVAATVDFDGQPVDVEVSPDGFYAFSLLEDARQLVVTTIGLGPTLRSLSRRSGMPGHTIVLAGDVGDPPFVFANFAGAGGSTIEVGAAIVHLGTSVAVDVPAGAVSGPVTLSVIEDDYAMEISGVSNSLYFEILQPATENRQRMAARVPMPGGWQINDALDVSPTGEFLAVGGTTGEVALVDIDPASPYFNQFINTFRVSNGRIEEIAITPDGERAFMALPDDSTLLRVYNVNRYSSRYGKAVGQIDFGTHSAQEITECAASPDGELLLLTDWTAGFVFVVDIRMGSATEYQILAALDLARCTSISFHPAGRYAYLADWAQRAIVVLNLDPSDSEYLTIGPTVVMPGTPPPAALDLEVTPDGDWLYVHTCLYEGGPQARTVYRYDVTTPSTPVFDPDLALRIPQGQSNPGLEKLVISPRGDRAVVWIHYGGYYLLDLTADPDTLMTGQFDYSVLTPLDLAFTPDASRLYSTGSLYDSLYIYDFTDAARISEVSGNFQNGVAGEFLQAPLRVAVQSAAGYPVAGAPVTFRVDQGGGMFPGNIVEQVVATDVNGRAMVEWQLGPLVGMQLVYAEAVQLEGSPIAFEAFASPDPGTLPLAVSQVLPIPSAAGVSVTTAAQVTFNRPVDPLSVTPGSLFLHRSGDTTPIGAYTGYADGYRKVSLLPDSPLDFSGDYVLAFTSKILDENGDTLTNPGISQFATLERPPVQIASISPPSGAAGINVVIAGAGFSPVPAENTVLFSGGSATPLEAEVDRLVVKVPLDAVPGLVRVVAYGDTSNPLQFTVLVPSASPIDEVVATVGTGSTTKSVTITPDGAIAYSVSPDGDVVIPIDVQGQATYPAIAVGDNPVAIVMHPEGTFAYTANLGAGTVSVIGVDPDDPAAFNKVVTTISVGTSPVDLAVSPDGDRIYVTNAGSANLSVIDGDDQSATHHAVVATVGTGTTGRSVAVTPDGTRIYVGTDTGYVVIDAMTNAVTATVGTGSTAKSVTITPDGGLLVLLTTEGEVLLIDIEPGSSSENQVVARVGTGSTTTSVTVSPDGALLYLIIGDSDIVVVYSLAIVGSVGALDPWVIIPPKTVETAPVDTIPTGTGPADIAFDPSGSGIAIITNAGENSVTILNTSPVPFGPLEAELFVRPRTIFMNSWGRWIWAWIELPPAYFPAEIDVPSVRMNGVIEAEPSPTFIVDRDEDGIEELVVRFDRAMFQEVIPQGEYVEVTVSGQARDREFIGVDTIRTIRPTVIHPSGCVVRFGELVDIRWISPAGIPITHVDVYWSPDDGETWIQIADDIPDEGHLEWTVPSDQIYPQCRVLVVLFTCCCEIGMGMSPEPFIITMPVAVALQSFEGEPSEDGALLRWETSYETNTTGFSIERSERENGGFETLEGGFVPAAGSPTGARYEFCDTTVALNREYWYVLREVSGGGSQFVFGPYRVIVRAPFSLAQNTPNPFNPSTTIKFTVPHDCPVRLAVYDVSGRRVRTLVDRTLRADFYRVEWDGTNDEGRQAASGIYFCRLTAGKRSQSRKMVLLR